MRYRALSPTGDMTFGQGSANFLVNSPDGVAQAITTKLRLWLGEWYLNLQDGTPYQTQILGRGTVGKYDQAIQNRIRQVPGVVSLLSYSSSLDVTTRSLSINARVLTAFGATPVSIILSPSSTNQNVISANISVANPGSQISGIAFAVSGTLAGYGSIPTLTFSNDGVNFSPLP